MKTSLETIVSAVRIAILDAIGDTRDKLNLTPWDKRGQVKSETFSRKIEEKMRERLSSHLPNLRFFPGGRWSDERYGVVAYTTDLLVLVEAVWILQQREAGLRQVNSLELKLSKTVRRTRGRKVLVFLASNKFVNSKAYAKFMSLKERIDQSIERVEVVNPSIKAVLP